MGNWPSDYIATDSTSGFGGKVVSNNWNEGGFGVTDSVMISGHRTVATKEDLYVIPTQILSSKMSNAKTSDGTDALGQLWYVEDEQCFYQLIKWDKHDDESGWSKSNIKSVSKINPDGTIDEVIESTQAKDGEWLTYVSVNGEGKMAMKSDGLHLTYTTNDKSYSSASKNQIFSVIDSIDVNGHTLSYNKTEITVLSQSHHGGSLDADATGFITGVSLSDTGTLTATKDNIKINESKENDLSYSSDESSKSFKVIDGIDLNGHIITYTSREITTLSQSHHSGSFQGDFLTKASLSSTGTLSGAYGTFDNNYVNANSYMTYLGNTPMYDNFSEHHPMLLDTDAISTDDFEVKDKTSGGAQIITYSWLDHNGKLWNTYAIPRNWIHGPIAIKTNSSYDTAELTYKANGKQCSTDIPIAAYSYPGYDVTAYTIGFMSSYMNKYFSAVINDFQDRILGKDKNYTLPTMSITGTKFTVWSADGTSNQKTATGNSINIEIGDYVQVEGSQCSFTNGTGELISTSGTWGTTIPSNGQFSGTKSAAKKQYTSSAEIFSQKIIAKTWEGAKSFQISNSKLIRKDAASSNSSTSVSVKINASYRANAWYGAVNFNPTTWTKNSTHNEDELKNSSGSYITAKVFTNSRQTISLTTTDTNPYCIYIYQAGTGTISDAKSTSGLPAKDWFNITSPIPIKIKSRTNGYVIQCYMLYGKNYNMFPNTTGIIFS